jgi:Gpi18-like mannosyltransferase
MGRTFFSALEQPRALWVIFAALVGLRLIAILAWVEPSSDAAWYFSRAAMLADGRGYLGDHGAPTAYWPPGWPLALSVLFRLTGPAIWAVGLVNLVLSCLAGWLLLDLARHVLRAEVPARLALLLWAVYPNAVLYVPLALTEVFYTTLLLALCWCLVARPGVVFWTVVAGLVLGLATLVKAQSLVVVPLVLAIALLREGHVWQRLPGMIGKGWRWAHWPRWWSCPGRCATIANWEAGSRFRPMAGSPC